MQARLRFVSVRRNPLRRSCVSGARNADESAFWIGRASLLEEVSYETVLETWRCTFGGSLVRNARFGDLALHFWRKSRTKRSFWRLGAPLLEEVSYETLVLETWRSTFGGSLVRNARFGDLALHFWRKSRTKRSFWRLGAPLLEEVSYETLVLESFTFGGSLVRNARFGDLALHFWSWAQTWPVCSANVVREKAFRSWT